MTGRPELVPKALGVLLAWAVVAGPALAAPPEARPAADDLSAVIDAKLAEAKVPASPPADDAEFLRRVYLDLTGIIPPYEKVAAFLDDTAAAKRARLIDELLDSPAYARHMAQLWAARLPDHALGRYYTHTGYRATTGVTHPGIGSVVAKEVEDADRELPAFIQVGPCFGGVTGDEAISRYSFYGAGFLGPRYQPLAVKEPAEGVDSIKAAVGEKEYDDRLELRAALGGEFAKDRPAGVVTDQEETVRRAVRLMRSKKLAAFDLSKETDKTRRPTARRRSARDACWPAASSRPTCPSSRSA